MDSIKLWARNGEGVRQAIELGEIAHLETASEELTDEFLLFGIESGLLQSWAEAFPDCALTGRLGYCWPTLILVLNSLICALSYNLATSPHNLANGRIMTAIEYQRRGFLFLLVPLSSAFIYL